MASMSQSSLRWFSLILLCAGMAVTNSGCSKKKEAPTTKSAEPVDLSASIPSDTAGTTGAQANAEFPNPGLLKPGTINEDGVEVGAAALTDALQNYYYATAGQVPESLDAMVRLKIVARIPTPPKGKKYVLDRKKAIVTVENAR